MHPSVAPIRVTIETPLGSVTANSFYNPTFTTMSHETINPQALSEAMVQAIAAIEALGADTGLGLAADLVYLMQQRELCPVHSSEDDHFKEAASRFFELAEKFSTEQNERVRQASRSFRPCSRMCGAHVHA